MLTAAALVLSNPIASLISAGKDAQSKDVDVPVSWKDCLRASKDAFLSKNAWLSHYSAFYQVFFHDDVRGGEDSIFSDRFADFSGEHRFFTTCLTLFFVNTAISGGLYAKYRRDVHLWQKAETQRIENQKIEDEKKAAAQKLAEQEAIDKKKKEDEAARQKKRADMIATIEMFEDELSGDFSCVTDMSDHDLANLLAGLSRKVAKKVLDGPVGAFEYLANASGGLAGNTSLRLPLSVQIPPPLPLVQSVGCLAGDSNNGALVAVVNSAPQGVRAVSDPCGAGESSISLAVPKVLRGLRPKEKFDVTDGGKTVEGVGIDQNTFTIEDLDTSQCYVLLSDNGTKILWALKHDGRVWRTIVGKGQLDASTKNWVTKK